MLQRTLLAQLAKLENGCLSKSLSFHSREKLGNKVRLQPGALVYLIRCATNFQASSLFPSPLQSTVVPPYPWYCFPRIQLPTVSHGPKT